LSTGLGPELVPRAAWIKLKAVCDIGGNFVVAVSPLALTLIRTLFLYVKSAVQVFRTYTCRSDVVGRKSGQEGSEDSRGSRGWWLVRATPIDNQPCPWEPLVLVTLSNHRFRL
jgi:hypothetical protein